MTDQHTLDIKPVLVLGATGYIGGRLVPKLLEAGYTVRAASRSLNKLRNRPWGNHRNINLVSADVSKADSIRQAMTGCGVVYYLVHSMAPEHQQNFEETDRDAAETIRQAAEDAGVARIIYLGGLGEDSEDLSKHLRSRAEVGRILKSGTVPVTMLRAAMIIGSGSASFEILRYLVERLPVMVTPKWVSTPSQPIAIRNVLNYLTGCLEHPETCGKTFDIGGPDILPYRKLMEIYAQITHLPPRKIIPVPFFTPKLSSYWIHLVTPLPAALAQPLAEGLKNPAVCQETTIRDIIPQPLLTCREAIFEAVKHLKNHQVQSHWTDAGALPPVETVYPGDPDWSGGAVYKDRRQMVVDAPPEALWQRIVGIGGTNGWYAFNWLWALRGLMDSLIGGVGLMRGRRDPANLQVGDALDFWRVLEVQPEKKLKLLAEMKLPGQALLVLELKTQSPTQTQLTQTAWFVPRGLTGVLYWYAVMPFHHWVFNGMLKGIALPH